MPLTNNDTFRRLRYALDLHDPELEEIFKLSGSPAGRPVITGLLKKETDDGFIHCTDKVLASFLDGLIIKKRGKKEDAKPAAPVKDHFLSNNAVLKKIRIALELQEDDLIAVMKLAGVEVSRSEMSALFRQKGHKNYKDCGDQFLRNFLTGLKEFKKTDTTIKQKKL